MNRNKNGSPVDASPAGGHPAAEELLRHVAGELLPEAGEQVRQHLEACRECRELVRDYADYPSLEPPTEAHRVDAGEARRTLGALRLRSLAAGEASPAEGEDSTAGPIRFPSSRRDRETPAASAGHPARWWGLAAAALLVVVSGWGVQRQAAVARLEKRARALEERLAASEAAFRRPRANAEVVSLLAAEDPLRSAEAPAHAIGEAGFTAVIPSDEPFPSGRYTAEIHQAAGEIVWRIPGLEPRAPGIFFYLPPGALPAGEYRVWLVRDADGEKWPTSFELPIRE